MFYNFKKILVILSAVLLVSCVEQPVKKASDLPVSFNIAIPILTNNLITQVNNKQGLLSGMGEKIIIFDPFIDANSHQTVKVSRQIEKIIFAEVKRNFGDKFSISRITPDSISKADYSMHGVILYDKYSGKGTMKGNFYHVESYVVQIKTGEIIAKTDIWISNPNLDYTPLVDNPMVIPGKQSVTEEIVKLDIGAKVPKAYDSSLKVGALISEADAAYENRSYKKALSLYAKASKQSVERKMMMKTYGGLYKSNIQLGNFSAAEDAFGKLVALSIEEYNTLSVKFLFSVSDTKFDRKLEDEYPIWLSQIGQYFKDNQLCLHIIGHSSRTGKLGYNCNLSLSRAEKIQQLLQRYFPRVTRNSKTDGKAWADNLVGSSTDDAQDAIDRRVEFKVDSCPIFDTRNRRAKVKDCINSTDEIRSPPSLL